MMKRSHILILTSLILASLITISPSKQNSEYFTYPVKLDESAKGVVIIDDIHDNDYPTALSRIFDRLENTGYLPFYASNFSDWKTALSKANYLMMTAVYTAIPSADIDEVNSWFSSGSRNLIMASRGDYSAINYTSMNSLLAKIGAGIQVQDDNVYTTDSNARQPWYIETNNFNSDYSQFFKDVDSVNLFSPSSLSTSGTAEVLINAEAKAYQSNENGNPPKVVYDNTSDSKGGEKIVLGAIDFPKVGNDVDRVVVVGTTLWADFDYGDSSADDTVFIDNVLKYFTEQTIATTGDIIIDLPDSTKPRL